MDYPLLAHLLLHPDYKGNGGDPLIKIIRNGQVYGPEPLGRKDVLVVGERFASVGEAIQGAFPDGVPVEVIDATGLCVFPGFIDGHVHIIGGGGEGSYHTRTPEIVLSSLVRAGITTVIGCLGTDGITRTMAALYAKAKGLEEEGVSAYILTGSYRVPIATLTGDPMRDIMFIDLVVGTGEIALSDHRSAQPTLEEIRRLAADIRVGAILAGKAGVMNVHLGDGASGLGMLREIVAGTELPYAQFLPTHVNRNERLFQESIDYALAGGFIDLTATSGPLGETGDLTAGAGLKRCLERGVPAERITFSSDGQGSLPVFNERQEMVRMDVGQVSDLYREVRDAIRAGVPVESALRTITRNPAEIYGLKRKGRIRSGFDADLVLVDAATLDIDTVIARGRTLMQGGQVKVAGTFE
jgi:beta-aspartyl-dipeptidase (metallo-type)